MSINRSTAAISASAAQPNTHKHTEIRIRVHHAFTQKTHTQCARAYTNTRIAGARTHTATAATAAVAFNVDRWQIKKTY